MDQFSSYLEIGFNHIVNWMAYDHLLFLIVLTVIYHIRDWKNLLILITAFTIGHSITLLSSVYDIFFIDSALIEFAIPMTILISSIFNLFRKPVIYTSRFQFNYFIALFFGMIHGMGLANDLKMLIGAKDFFYPLLAFNLGVEGGQVVIVALVLIISFIFTEFFGIQRRDWNLIISSAVGGVSIMLIFENKIW